MKTTMRSLLFATTILMTGCAPGSAQIQNENSEYVVLLHGLGRSDISMISMGRHLKNEGYKVVNLGYPSRSHPLDKLAKLVKKRLDKEGIERAKKVHFVTHSLGGIIVREILHDRPLRNLGRVVMLSPPNGGSELADRYKDNIWYKLFAGPVGQELGTTPNSRPNRLGPPKFEVGIIAGEKSLLPFFSNQLPGKDDGIVAVEKTKLAKMKDFLIVPSTHTFIMNSPEVKKQVSYFLDTGEFRRDS